MWKVFKHVWCIPINWVNRKHEWHWLIDGEIGSYKLTHTDNVTPYWRWVKCCVTHRWERRLSCRLKYLPHTSQENVTSGLLWVRSWIIRLYGLVNRRWQYLHTNSHFGRILRRKSDLRSSLSIRITANILVGCFVCGGFFVFWGFWLDGLRWLLVWKWVVFFWLFFFVYDDICLLFG